MKKLNNTVIKNLSPEMGRMIIEKYQADGWNTWDIKGVNFQGRDSVPEIYYGVINGLFSCYRLSEVQSANARIIDLDTNP